MKTIGDLIARDLSQPIEEVIKLDQRDEQTVYGEIVEYVATKNIKEQYLELLTAIADSQGEPTEAVGVWVSGFFGSGKSSFAKNFGYIVANPTLRAKPAAALFIEQLRRQSPHDPLVEGIANHLDFINKLIPAQVIMFDVQVDRAVRRANESLAEIMYSVLLRELDYAQDYDVAALEIELESEGRLGAFVQACARLFGGQVSGDGESDAGVPVTLKEVPPDAYRTWQRVRKGAQKIQRASATLHEIDPKTYPRPESWAQTITNPADINVRYLVQRTFELAARRYPGRTMMFVIDEVGQYVARSAEKIENLRAIVEQFGKEGKNRVEARRAVAPVWIVVTSQEKLDEVVAAIRDKRVELARLQDRFRHHIDMVPSDIREVATKRVLPKKPEAEALLRELYRTSGAQLRTHIQAERSDKVRFDLNADEFVQFYPYLPHFIELSIDIVSGLRLQPGAPRHFGGSSRTIIKQAYEMLVSKQTRLAEAPIGTLVTLDRIYDLLYTNLPSERQRDLNEIQEIFSGEPWVVRTAKAISLMEYTRGLPRSERNIAVLLYDAVDAKSPLAEVEQAIQQLEKRQFIRQTEDGWKLLTAQEKTWTTERNSLSPSLRERNDLMEGALAGIFQEPALSRHLYKRRTFALNVIWQGRNITSNKAQIPLELKLSDSPAGFAAECQATQNESRQAPARLFWVFALTDDIDELLAEVYRSKQMAAKYDQMRAQGKLHSDEEAASLAAEKQAVLRHEERLKNLLLDQLARGTGFLGGAPREGAQLGKMVSEIFHALFDFAMPQLYPQLELGARPIKGDEAEEILKAANLNGLAKVFYAGDEGLGLVIQDRGKFIINDNAPIAKEIVAYVQREHSYGNKVTGRMLEDHFRAIPYGWEPETVWIVLASLLRKGTIEVTYQGRRFRHHLDPQVRPVFTGANAFRAASFAPRKAPDLQTLVGAAKRYEALTGEEVDVDENAIAQGFQKLASAEREALLEVIAKAAANDLPGADLLAEYRSQLNTIIQSPSDDVVNILAGEGETFKQLRQQTQEIRKATDPAGLRRLQRARTALNQLWPVLAERAADATLQAQMKSLDETLQSLALYREAAQIDAIAGDVEAAYTALYRAGHQTRAEAYTRAIEFVKGLPDWASVPETMQDPLLAPLQARACDQLELPAGALACGHCRATLPEMESDLDAMPALRERVIHAMQELLQPEQKIKRVRMAEVVSSYQALSTPQEVEELLNRLRDHLLKLLESGAKIVLE
ncbi:MAG: BREX system P-loop protein BrxC [Chloroflexi bacterium]|nr:BREX system P-loop protein BrxC [Chloroflexota bacterium]